MGTDTEGHKIVVYVTREGGNTPSGVVVERTAVATQSRVDSVMEVVTNIAIGLSVAFIANFFVLPWFLGVTPSFTQNVGISAAFTAISFIRSYTIRRLFNGKSVWTKIRQTLSI